MCWSKPAFYSVKDGDICIYFTGVPKPHPPHGHYIHGDVGKLKFFFLAVAAKLVI